MGHEFRSFWLGEHVSPLEYLCIRSFLAHGHRYVLYTYGPVAGLPPGCELADAREVLPEERVFLAPGLAGRTQAGSPSGFTNLFRYKLIGETGGWWVDTDVLCCSAEISDSEYVFAQEQPDRYGSAVLRAPKGCALMSFAYERALEHGSDFEWGTIGPELLTRVIDELGLGAVARTRAELYPWTAREALAVLDPAQTERLERLMEASSFCHFWNEVLRRYGIDKERRPPTGSLLDRLYDAYDVPLRVGSGYTDAELAPQMAAARKQLVAAVRDGKFQPELWVLDGDFEPVEHYWRESGLLDQLGAAIGVAEQLRGRPLAGEGADVGAGCLWAMPHLLGPGRVERVYAVERSRHRLQTLGPAVLRHYAVPADAVVLHPGSLFELGLPDRCLDFVLMSEALDDAEDRKPLLAEVRRVLAPDGVVLVIGEPLFEERRGWAGHLVRETVARALPRSLQRRVFGRVLAAEGWRRPDRWVRNPVTGEYSYRGSAYARLFTRAAFAASEIPDAEHNSQSFVLRPS